MVRIRIKYILEVSKIVVSFVRHDVMKWDLANGHVIASNYAWTMTYSFVKRAEFLQRSQ